MSDPSPGDPGFHGFTTRRDLAYPEGVVEPDLLDRVEAALDGLELFGSRGVEERRAYAGQLAREAERAGCDEVAMIARMVLRGGRVDLQTGIRLARKALKERRGRMMDHAGP